MRPVIVHLATDRGITSFRNTKRRGQQLGYEVVPVRYSELLKRTEWPRGMYFFSDMERASKWQCSIAAQLWQQLADRPGGYRLYNHPVRHLRRYELLRALHEAGINDFTAYRLDEITHSVRYPVFVRYTDQHIGPSTGLLYSEAELEDALAKLLIRGHPPDRLIVVEFQDTSQGTGRFKKFGAFRLGEHVYTGHMMAAGEWSVKREINDSDLVGDEDLNFVRNNPYADQIMQAFQVAGLTWGRIDFGVLDGRIQVWEINDNPKLGSSIFNRSMGRKISRRVSREIRRGVFATEMAKVVPGDPLKFKIDASEALRSPCFARASAAPEVPSTREA
ncbi:MAG TPA: hypothetical protein VMM36_15685 [Opitutaceae bacterium]|nr:hypothetical protein [Opitutaceae bacterium]